MKQLKRFALFFSIFAALAVISTVPAHAQNGRTHMTPQITQGQWQDLGGAVGAPTDSLGVSDTTTYYVPITHTNLIFPYLTWEWTKTGSGSATITLTAYQSNDNVNYAQLKAGVAQTAYSKTYSTLAASANEEVDFNRDTVAVGGRYLKLQWITSSTASVKGGFHARVKANVK